MTEHPTSFDRPSTGADPTDPRGALLRTPVPPRASGSALPAQGGTGQSPPAAGEDSPGAFEHSQPGAEQAAEPDTHRPRPTSEGVPAQPDGGQPGGAPSDDTPSAGVTPADVAPGEVSAGGGQAGLVRPDSGSPDSGAPAGAPDPGRRDAPPDPDRRTGQPTAPGRPTPMRRDGDRLRFVGAATRRIARGMDLDEIVMGLCRATVP
ncbi:serine/threonine protein phosphatase, partial [Streptomyces tendae]